MLRKMAKSIFGHLGCDAVTGVIVFQKSVFRAERHETLSKDQAEMLQQAIPEESVLSASAGIAYVIPAWPPLPSQPFVVNEMIEVAEAGHELTALASRLPYARRLAVSRGRARVSA